MRKDADILDRAVDQIAAMQSGRGKGMCLQLPLAILVCNACPGNASKGQGQQQQQRFQRQPPQPSQGQGKKKRRERSVFQRRVILLSDALVCQASATLSRRTSTKATRARGKVQLLLGTHTRLPRRSRREACPQLMSKSTNSGRHSSDEGLRLPTSRLRSRLSLTHACRHDTIWMNQWGTLAAEQARIILDARGTTGEREFDATSSFNLFL